MFLVPREIGIVSGDKTKQELMYHRTRRKLGASKELSRREREAEERENGLGGGGNEDEDDEMDMR